MKATTILASLIVLGTTFIENASANYLCYRTGHSMDTKDLQYHSRRACRGYDDIRGAFQGTFGPNQQKTACVNYGGSHIDMNVKNLNPSKSFDLKDEDCENEFRWLIRNCNIQGVGTSLGGQVTRPSGWYFRYDFAMN